MLLTGSSWPQLLLTDHCNKQTFLKINKTQYKNRLHLSSFYMKAGSKDFCYHCKHHKDIYEVILGAADMGFFYVGNVSDKGFLDMLMIGLRTTDKIRSHTKLGVNKSDIKLKIAKVILGSSLLTCFWEQQLHWVQY